MRGMEGYMRGVNLGGWLSQFDAPTKEHFDSFITEEDIRRIAGMGLDHVRVPVDYTVIETEDGQPIEEGYHYIDNCVQWCRANGLHMILDIHKTYGYSFDPLDKDDKLAFFTDPARQKRFLDMWRTIAKRYSADTDVVAYELLNEIVAVEVRDLWNGIALRAIEAIRAFAPDTWIIFGGVNYNAVTAVPWLADTPDRRVAYTFHCYEPLIFTHQGAYWVENMPLDFRIGYPKPIEEYREAARRLNTCGFSVILDEDVRPIGPDFFAGLFEPAIRTAVERDIPLYCGEYGVIDRACREDAVRWLADIHEVFEKYAIGRALWNYKEKDYGIAGDEAKPYLQAIADKL
ncbi:MAG: cellulase family glycosylhydrolase [Lachnospiraceae bacterium]|jgi:hypothetical protein|nr:cellulase family glycosylhydrolase [Lachnospiraceae bacterium]